MQAIKEEAGEMGIKFVCMRCGDRICCNATGETGAAKSCRSCKFRFLEMCPADEENYEIKNFRLCEECVNKPNGVSDKKTWLSWLWG